VNRSRVRATASKVALHQGSATSAVRYSKHMEMRVYHHLLQKGTPILLHWADVAHSPVLAPAHLSHPSLPGGPLTGCTLSATATVAHFGEVIEFRLSCKMPDGIVLAPCAQFPSESMEFSLTQYSSGTSVSPAPRIVGRECDFVTGAFILRSVVDGVRH